MGPKSRAEIQKAYRERKGDELKRTERERMKKIRVEQKKDPVKMAKIRKQKTIVMRKLREKVKAIEVVTPTRGAAAFKSYSSERRATVKALASLPRSPRKRTAIVKNMSSMFNVITAPIVPRDGIPKQTIDKITNFYLRETISRWCAGRKEFVKVGAEKVQKRFLLYSLTECYSMFVEEFGELVKKSKFASLRPEHVFSYGSTPIQSCCCLTHQNFMYICNAIAVYLPGLRKYDNCSKGQLFDIKILNDDSDLDVVNVSYQWWMSDGNRVEQVTKTESLQDAVTKFKDLCSSFLIHHITKRQQSLSFSEQKDSVSDESQKLFHFDFSENFSCVYQDAAQSTYWAQHQVTLFTVALYVPGQVPKMICFVTDLNNHTKIASSYFLNGLVAQFCHPGDNVIFWSDGPSSQFKNRFMFEYMRVLVNKFCLGSLKWNFSATSHGKGAIDGVGGTLKRTVYAYVKARQGVVKNAQDFANVIISSQSSVQVIHVSGEVIETFYSTVETTLESASKRPGIKLAHYWEYMGVDWTMHNLSPRVSAGVPLLQVSPSSLICHQPGPSTSASQSASSVIQLPISAGKLKQGDYVVVNFQGRAFIGCITRVYGTADYDGSFMRKKKGSMFSFPMNLDESAFELDKVIFHLKDPLIGRHDTYDFKSSDYDFSCVQ